MLCPEIQSEYDRILNGTHSHIVKRQVKRQFEKCVKSGALVWARLGVMKRRLPGGVKEYVDI